MPLPTPTPQETQSEFMSRCMGDDIMQQEYPDQEQRSGVCHSLWEQSQQNKTSFDGVLFKKS